VTGSPSISPSDLPTDYPSLSSSFSPSLLPTQSPTLTPNQSDYPTTDPTSVPTLSPNTIHPSNNPSVTPIALSGSPSTSPITDAPSTFQPTINSSITTSPLNQPSYSPTHQTSSPSSRPSVRQSKLPTLSPSPLKTVTPNHNPTFIPTLYPTIQHSDQPTIEPSSKQTNFPSIKTSIPTQNPTNALNEFVIIYDIIQLLNIQNQSSINISNDKQITADFKQILKITLKNLNFSSIVINSIYESFISNQRRKLYTVVDISTIDNYIVCNYTVKFNRSSSSSDINSVNLELSQGLFNTLNHSICTGQFTDLMHSTNSTTLLSTYSVIVPNILTGDVVAISNPTSSNNSNSSNSSIVIYIIVAGCGLTFLLILGTIYYLYYLERSTNQRTIVSDILSNDLSNEQSNNTKVFNSSINNSNNEISTKPNKKIFTYPIDTSDDFYSFYDINDDSISQTKDDVSSPRIDLSSPKSNQSDQLMHSPSQRVINESSNHEIKYKMKHRNVSMSNLTTNTMNSPKRSPNQVSIRRASTVDEKFVNNNPYSSKNKSKSDEMSVESIKSTDSPISANIITNHSTNTSDSTDLGVHNMDKDEKAAYNNYMKLISKNRKFEVTQSLKKVNDRLLSENKDLSAIRRMSQSQSKIMKIDNMTDSKADYDIGSINSNTTPKSGRRRRRPTPPPIK